MSKILHLHLSRRESQIMDIVYRLGEASVEEVRRQMPDDVSYNSVRVTLGILEKKNQLVHRRFGNQHLYRPKVSAEKAGESILRHVLRTFFGGSMRRAVSTLLDMSAGELTREELDELARRVDEAREDQKANEDDGSRTEETS